MKTLQQGSNFFSPNRQETRRWPCC